MARMLWYLRFICLLIKTSSCIIAFLFYRHPQTTLCGSHLRSGLWRFSGKIKWRSLQGSSLNPCNHFWSVIPIYRDAQELPLSCPLLGSQEGLNQSSWPLGSLAVWNHLPHPACFAVGSGSLAPASHHPVFLHWVTVTGSTALEIPLLKLL